MQSALIDLEMWLIYSRYIYLQLSSYNTLMTSFDSVSPESVVVLLELKLCYEAAVLLYWIIEFIIVCEYS